MEVLRMSGTRSVGCVGHPKIGIADQRAEAGRNVRNVTSGRTQAESGVAREMTKPIFERQDLGHASGRSDPHNGRRSSQGGSILDAFTPSQYILVKICPLIKLTTLVYNACRHTARPGLPATIVPLLFIAQRSRQPRPNMALRHITRFAQG